jgi:hypothetical protein
MQPMNNIPILQYIKHSEVDSEKWNRCIDGAQNSRVYAYDWHLDRTAIVWDALVLGDYDFVMPLPVRKKWRINYLYQPLFSQQLGIFPIPPQNIAQLFYLEIVKLFPYSSFHLNSKNPLFENEDNIEFNKRENYLLPLSEDYKTIANSYSKNTKRNLAKANKNDLHLIIGIQVEEYIEFKKKNLSVQLSKNELNSLKSIIAFGQYKGFGEIYGVYSTNNELCAAAYFCQWKDRVIYMTAASNQMGKELGGMIFLVDGFIQKHANKNLKIDFEGSMLPGVARFYIGFGATPETYFQLKYNRLPLPFKWLKRN